MAAKRAMLVHIMLLTCLPAYKAVRNVSAAQAAAGMAFLMNKAFLGASLGAQNGSKTVMMAKATKVVKKAAQQVASKVGGGSAKGFRRYQGACTLPG